MWRQRAGLALCLASLAWLAVASLSVAHLVGRPAAGDGA